MGISGWQLILVLVIVFVLFGAGKLPRVMGDLGRGVRSMKDGLKGEGETDESKAEKLSDDEKKAVNSQTKAVTGARIIDVEEETEVVPAKKAPAKKKAVSKAKKKAPKVATKKAPAKTKASAKKKATKKTSGNKKA